MSQTSDILPMAALAIACSSSGRGIKPNARDRVSLPNTAVSGPDFFVITVQHVRAEIRRKGRYSIQRKNCPKAIDTVSEKVYIVIADTVSTLRQRGNFGGKINDKRNA